MRAKYVTVAVASARNVAERWASQYREPDGIWRDTKLPNQKTRQEIYDQLVALGDTPPIDKVADVIGNKSWSYLTCDGCSAQVERAVGIGEYEPKTYCATCIAEAKAALESAA